MALHRQSERTEPAARPGSADAVGRLDQTSLKGSRMPMSTVTSTTSTRVGSPRLPARTPGGPPGAAPGEEQWVTKRQLADHLQVTPRWIELQHPHGLPHLRRGGIVRYRISEVESWLLSSPTIGGA